jgi:predicted site-specific integrase-resolvase
MASDTEASLPALIPLITWRKRIGVSPVTVWRWRQQGWLHTVTIGRRPYVTEDAIRSFVARAKAGEFAGTSAQ